jgi:hypothetical protein
VFGHDSPLPAGHVPTRDRRASSCHLVGGPSACAVCVPIKGPRVWDRA